MIELLSLFVGILALPFAYLSIPVATRRKFLLIRWPRNRQISSNRHFLEEIVSDASQTVSPVMDVFELRDIWSIDNTHYGDFNIKVETLEDWWRTFPDGLIVIRDDTGKIQGGMGYWPVSNNWIENVSRDCSPETCIDCAEMKKALTDTKAHSWYISGIVIDEPNSNHFARRQIANVLMLAFTKIAERKPKKNTVLYSMPISESGARLLRRFHFKQITHITCDPPLYSRNFDYDILRSLSMSMQEQ